MRLVLANDKGTAMNGNVRRYVKIEKEALPHSQSWQGGVRKQWPGANKKGLLQYDI